MSESDVQRALKTLRRHGYDVDPDSRKLITLAENHIYMRLRETVGTATIEKAVAIPLFPSVTEVGQLVEQVFLIMEERLGSQVALLDRGHVDG